MANNIKMLMGEQARVGNVANVAGQLLYTTDTGYIYLDTDGTVEGRIRLYDEVVKDVDKLESLVGSKSVATQIQEAIQQLINGGEEGDEDSSIRVVTEVVGGDGIFVDRANPAKPRVSAKLATGNNALKLDASGSLYVDKTELPDYSLTVTTTPLDGNNARRYTLTQATTGLNIDIDVPAVVKSANVVVDPEGEDPGTYLEVVVPDGSGGDKTLYLKADEIVKAATAKNDEGAQVIVSVSSESEISATLSQSVKDSLGLADTAVQPSDLVYEAGVKKYIAGIKLNAEGALEFITETLPEGTGSLVWETF